MKTAAAIGFLPFFANAAVIKRQGHGGGEKAHGGGSNGFNIPGLEGFKFPGMNYALPKDGIAAMLNPQVRKAYKIENLAPQRWKDARRVRITHGPYKLGASSAKKNVGNSFSMDPSGTGYTDLVGNDFPRDALILDGTSLLVNETFQPAIVDDGIYNHHTLFTDLNKRPVSWLACNGSPLPEAPGAVFLGSGSDDNINRYNSPDNQIKSGFYVGKKDTIFFGLDVVNYHDRERTLYMVNEIEYYPGMPEGYTHAQNHVVPLGLCDGLLSVMSANNIHAPVNEKKFTLQGKNEIEVTRDGHLIATTGHLHDGGLKMDITINGTKACESKIEYGGPGHEQVQPNGEVWKTISRNVACDAPIRVHKGDRLQLYAHFDFNAHPPRMSSHGQEAEGMALALTTFVPL